MFCRNHTYQPGVSVGPTAPPTSLWIGDPSPNSHLPLVILPHPAGMKMYAMYSRITSHSQAAACCEQEPRPPRLPELVRRHRRMDQAVQHVGLPVSFALTAES